MKRFFLLLIAFSTLAFAHNSEKAIKSIRYSSLADKFSASIVLTDGTVWRWLPDVYSEYYLQEWQEGDRIVIGVIEHPGYVLYNLDKPRFAAVVALSNICRKKLPRVQALNPDEVILSDGSLWTPSGDDYLQHLRNWKVGDPVILTMGIGGDHEIINTALPYSYKGLDLRFLPVWENWQEKEVIEEVEFLELVEEFEETQEE